VEGLTFFETFFDTYYTRSSLTFFLELKEKDEQGEWQNFLRQVSYLLTRPTTQSAIGELRKKEIKELAKVERRPKYRRNIV
jgi:hypothetical protein